jgi:iron(III) transport system substrate-binding protein
MMLAMLLILLSLIVLGVTGCNATSSDQRQDVIVYTALDSDFSKPIFTAFEEQTGIRPLPRFDTESTKTVGLATAIINEKARPRCDVFWNNEILHSLRLEKQGLLEAYHSPSAQDYPEMYRSPDGYWHGFAARARILIVNTDSVPENERPDSILDLTDSKWRGKIGIAKPLFGTTATHAACLFAHWGAERAKQFFQDLKANDVQILSGNKQVALAATSGQIAFGITDTDDAIIELEKGAPVAIVYPDRNPDELGTLFIPNTLAIVKGCPHPQAARALVDYLLSPEVETKLAASSSAQIPLNPNVDAKVRVETPKSVHAMPVDFSQAAEQWDVAAPFLQEHFTGG